MLVSFIIRRIKNIKCLLGCMDHEYSLILDFMRGKVKFNDKSKIIKEVRNPISLALVT